MNKPAFLATATIGEGNGTVVVCLAHVLLVFPTLYRTTEKCLHIIYTVEHIIVELVYKLVMLVLRKRKSNNLRLIILKQS